MNFSPFNKHFILSALLLTAALAAPEKIQIYLDEFAAPGKFGLDFHTNYVRSAQPGSMTRGQLRVTPELSYGINQHWEAALYLLTSAGPELLGGRPMTDGAKVRLKWRPRGPSADSPRYGAINFEVGQLSQRFYSEGTSAEFASLAPFVRQSQQGFEPVAHFRKTKRGQGSILFGSRISWICRSASCFDRLRINSFSRTVLRPDPFFFSDLE